MEKPQSRSNGKRRIDEEEETPLGEDHLGEQKPEDLDVPDAEDEHDADEDAEADEDEEDTSPRSKKRARVNEEGDSIDADAEPRPSFKARRVKLPRDKDG